MKIPVKTLFTISTFEFCLIHPQVRA